MNVASFRRPVEAWPITNVPFRSSSVLGPARRRVAHSAGDMKHRRTTRPTPREDEVEGRSAAGNTATSNGSGNKPACSAGDHRNSSNAFRPKRSERTAIATSVHPRARVQPRPRRAADTTPGTPCQEGTGPPAAGPTAKKVPGNGRVNDEAPRLTACRRGRAHCAPVPHRSAVRTD